jgi:hypothetical protein
MDRYIVLAHMPKNPDAPEFEGEFGLHPTEWVIFDGVHGKAQAEAKAEKFRKFFREVQIRTVSETL